MEALRGAPAFASAAPSRPTSSLPSRLWLRNRLWQRALQATRRPAPPWAPPPPPPPTSADAPDRALLSPWQKDDGDDDDDDGNDDDGDDDDPDARRRRALRELLGGVRDDAALAALDARAPGLAAFEPAALAATLDALGAVLGLERRHLLRVVALAPRLLTDPGRARRAVEGLGRVLGAPRATDVGAYGRAFPPLLALLPDDGGGEDGQEADGGEAGTARAGDPAGEGAEAGLRGRVRALARLLLPPPPPLEPTGDGGGGGGGGGEPAYSPERAFRAWAREFPPRAAALLSQPAAEVAAKVARLARALAPPGGGALPPAPEAARAARMLALARPLLLDVGEAVLRSRVVALARAGGMEAPALAALALSAGGGNDSLRWAALSAASPPSSAPSPPPPPQPPLVPQGIQGCAELLMCAPQRLSEWSEAMCGLMLPPPPLPEQAPGAATTGNKSALPLAAARAAPGGPRAFALECLLLLGARAPADVVSRWQGLQTAAWRRPDWRREVEERFGARDVAACLSCRHDQMARVAFLASDRAREGRSGAAAEAVGLLEAVRGSADFDRRFPEFRTWLEKGE